MAVVCLYPFCACTQYAHDDPERYVYFLFLGNFLILKKRQEADWQKYLIACYTEKVLKKTLLGVEG
jgi:hypothetical protein